MSSDFKLSWLKPKNPEGFVRPAWAQFLSWIPVSELNLPTSDVRHLLREGQALFTLPHFPRCFVMLSDVDGGHHSSGPVLKKDRAGMFLYDHDASIFSQMPPPATVIRRFL